MSITSRSLGLWAVTGWLTDPERNAGGSFTLWASPEFLKVAQAVPFDRARFQHSVDYIISTAQGRPSDILAGHPARWLDGLLVGWSVPGSCACMGIDNGLPADWRTEGAEYSPHNVDGTLQQSTLMSIWMLYAQAVEAHISRWIRQRQKSATTEMREVSSRGEKATRCQRT